MADKNSDRMEKIVSLCKRRGFIFQAGELYGGLNGCWDYGPLGVELKRNLKDYWWRRNVRMRDDIEGLDGAILTHQAVLTASGHVGGFSDPLCICLLTGERLRADQIPAQSGFVFEFSGAISSVGLAEIEKQSGKVPDAVAKGFAAAVASGRSEDEALAAFAGAEGTESLREHLKTAKRIQHPFRVLVAANAPDKALKVARQFYDRRGLKNPWPVGPGFAGEVVDSLEFNPANGAQLSPPRQFNLMFQTTVGASAEENDPNAIAYLRPETAQSIFVQFRNVLDTSRQKLPFGIAQIGKAFRNEINPRNFTFRSREFEQIELEFFIRPDEAVELICGKVATLADNPDLAGPPQENWGWEVWHKYWVEQRLSWFRSIGLPGARACVDIEFAFPFGVQELEGIAARSDFDLSQHQKHSGKTQDVFDEALKQAVAKLDDAARQAFAEKTVAAWTAKGKSEEDARAFVAKLLEGRYVPHVIEPSAGTDRLALALLCNAYEEQTLTDDKGKTDVRTVLHFHPAIAPIKAAVFPIVKNRPELYAKAREIFAGLQRRWNCFWDESGAIGRRYRRMDEVGTPFCVTVDFETLEQGTVTVRDRDTMKQERIAVSELRNYLETRIEG